MLKQTWGTWPDRFQGLALEGHVAVRNQRSCNARAQPSIDEWGSDCVHVSLARRPVSANGLFPLRTDTDEGDWNSHQVLNA